MLENINNPNLSIHRKIMINEIHVRGEGMIRIY